MIDWIFRVAVIALCAWIVVTAVIVLVRLVRQESRLDLEALSGFLARVLFAGLLAASVATENRTPAWAALAVWVVVLIVRGVGVLLSPAQGSE